MASVLCSALSRANESIGHPEVPCGAAAASELPSEKGCIIVLEVNQSAHLTFGGLMMAEV